MGGYRLNVLKAVQSRELVKRAAGGGRLETAGLPLWVVASVVTAGLALLYILWGPPSPRKRKRGWVAGLENAGNTCFLNAVLQALSACRSCVGWLEMCQRRYHNTALFPALHSTLTELNQPDSSCCSPMSVIAALRANRWVMTNEEQDAHELFHVLTATLEEEEKRAKKLSFSFGDIPSLEEESVEPGSTVVGRGGVPQPPANAPGASGFSSPTRGLLASQMGCRRCGYRYPVCYDTFDSVSLGLLPSGPRSLHDCLRKFVSPELVTDASCEKCPPPASKTTFLKQLSFGKLPQCLCFHLHRTMWMPTMAAAKNFEHVAFPEYLNMDSYLYRQPQSSPYPWARLLGGSTTPQQQQQHPLLKSFTAPSLPRRDCSSGESPPSSAATALALGSSPHHLYRLMAVIVHLGDMYSGHFITYRRGAPGTKDWFCTSDTAVRRADLAEVLASTAFMLFYEALPPTQSPAKELY